MLKASIRLGTIAGIPIRVHNTWFIIFFLLSAGLFADFDTRYPEWGAIITLATATATTLLFFACIILHELGHSLVAISRGIKVQDITLFIFGGVAQITKDSTSAASEFWVAIAGPAVSLSLAGLFYLLKLWLTPYSEIATEAFDWLMLINLVVAIFNLVPGFPLDGGRVFRALVWWITGNAAKGMQMAVVGGKAFAFFLMFLGLLIVLQTGQLLNGLWLMGIGWFLLISAEASRRGYALDQLVGNLTAADIMQTDVPTISADTCIQDWVDQNVLLTGQRAFLVKKGVRIIGLVTLSDAAKLPREQWRAIPVHEIMTPVERLYTVQPIQGIDDVMKTMQQHSVNQVPVIDAGHIVGWIDRQRVLRFLQTYSEAAR